jgi:hypothetical protein
VGSPVIGFGFAMDDLGGCCGRCEWRFLFFPARPARCRWGEEVARGRGRWSALPGFLSPFAPFIGSFRGRSWASVALVFFWLVAILSVTCSVSVRKVSVVGSFRWGRRGCKKIILPYFDIGTENLLLQQHVVAAGRVGDCVYEDREQDSIEFGRLQLCGSERVLLLLRQPSAS